MIRLGALSAAHALIEAKQSRNLRICHLVEAFHPKNVSDFFTESEGGLTTLCLAFFLAIDLIENLKNILEMAQSLHIVQQGGVATPF